MNTNNKRFLVISILGLLASGIMSLLVSCSDDVLYNPSFEPGDGTIDMSIAFQPLYGVETVTRTPGDAIHDIESLAVVFFDKNGKLVKIVNNGDAEMKNWYIDQGGNTTMPGISSGATAGSQAEATTPRATFTLENLYLPVGEYKIYAVANMGILTPEMTPTEEYLKSTVLTWNADYIASNNQMLGYFTKVETTGNQGNMPGNFDAPSIRINPDKEKMYLHSWVRRAASKVTVAYDSSKLNDDVWIYINKVTIRDIPKTCYLGKTNTPDKKDELIGEGESLYYDENGVFVPTEQAPLPPTDHTHWLTLTNDDKLPVGSDHSETAPALFFYENMQGDYKDYKNEDGKDKYNKEHSASPAHGVLVDPGNEDYKDEVPYGTYVEVEAYYDSRNPNNLGAGKIIYRFMLGKDVTYNYNAERNHHFKLTLCFNGWANQADWHIEYTEEDPDIITPPMFYMPYLYNQRAYFPLKLNGNVKSLHVEIIENGWAPVSQSDHKEPAQTVGSFQWNRPAFDSQQSSSEEDKEKFQSVGFLALAVPNETGEPAKNVVDLNFNTQMTAINQLYDLYKEERTTDGYTWSQKARYYDVSEGTHQPGNNEYTVTKADMGNEITVQIPLWTRNKTMIANSGYTGNNPYEAYQRKAKIRITAVFNVTPTQEYPTGERTMTKEVPIYQVRRLVNPKGVWRSYSDNDDFFVHLMTLNSRDDPQYSYYKSEGSWSATIESGAKDFCYLTDENGTVLDVIEGATDSEIKFYIKFNGTVSSGVTKGCVVNVDYNGGSCKHKILVRQGYNTPVAIVADGARWSSFNLYDCEGNRNNSSRPAVGAELTRNPLSIGSFFKRRNYRDAIVVSNNNVYGPLVPLDFKDLKVKTKDGSLRDVKWADIPTYHTEDNNTGYPWATFTAVPPGSSEPKTYRVPNYNDYKALDNAEFATGIVYADGAKETLKTFDAYGFEDGENNTYSSKLGIRGYLVYNKESGNQIFFPLGKYGMARRTQYNLGLTEEGYQWNGTYNPRAGYLRYGDVYSPLTGEGNMWRPIPYDLPSCPGAIYWINLPEPNGHPTGVCGGWDMNYFSLDFSSYTYNNRNDACPVKPVLAN